MKIFAERFKELRNEQGLSTTEIAKKIGTSNASVSRWENDIHDPSISELKQIAVYFKVSADFLIGLED